MAIILAPDSATGMGVEIVVADPRILAQVTREIVR